MARRHPISLALLLFSLGLGATGSMAATTQPSAVEEILAAHVEASGGEKALRAMKILHRSGDITFDSQFTGTISGTFEMLFVHRAKLYRASVLGDFPTTTVWNGTEAWEVGPQGHRTIADDELDRLRVETDHLLLTGLDLPEGAQVERFEDRDLDGAPHYTLRYFDGGPMDITAYLDKETHMVSQTVQEIPIPGMGTAIVVVDFWDYRAHEGVMLPDSVSVAIEGVFTSETTFSETVINGPVDDALFAKPQ